MARAPVIAGILICGLTTRTFGLRRDRGYVLEESRGRTGTSNEDTAEAVDAAEITCSKDPVVAAQWKHMGLIVSKEKGNGHAYVKCGEYNGELEEPQKVSCLREECGGSMWCFVKNRCGGWFNSCAKIDVELNCKRSYVVMPGNTNTCSAASQSIPDEESCQNACATLGCTYQGKVKSRARPRGCYKKLFGKAFFNEHPVGTALENRFPICMPGCGSFTKEVSCPLDRCTWAQNSCMEPTTTTTTIATTSITTTTHTTTTTTSTTTSTVLAATTSTTAKRTTAKATTTHTAKRTTTKAATTSTSTIASTKMTSTITTKSTNRHKSVTMTTRTTTTTSTIVTAATTTTLVISTTSTTPIFKEPDERDVGEWLIFTTTDRDAITTSNAATIPTRASCLDADEDNVTDSGSDSCTYYSQYPQECGRYDSDEFAASSACCVCGGGDRVR